MECLSHLCPFKSCPQEPSFNADFSMETFPFSLRLNIVLSSVHLQLHSVRVCVLICWYLYLCVVLAADSLSRLITFAASVMPCTLLHYRMSVQGASGWSREAGLLCSGVPCVVRSSAQQEWRWIFLIQKQSQFLYVPCAVSPGATGWDSPLLRVR